MVLRALSAMLLACCMSPSEIANAMNLIHTKLELGEAAARRS
jgi:hypothetical protein